MGVETAGVCLLHSYVNPAHEIRLRQIFSEEYPECHVSLSSDVLPEYQEYERALTTLMDAACKPVIKGYIDRAETRIRETLTPETPFLVMKSNGGVMGAGKIAGRPLTTALSGPAAGVLACSALAREAARTLAYYGETATEFADIGVAGLWRLEDRLTEIRAYPIAIVVAGMDGAIASVLGGLYGGAMIVVPTSTGYGAARGGETALAAALASCAPGLTVVNIDNGYGAACAALRMLRSLGA